MGRPKGPMYIVLAHLPKSIHIDPRSWGFFSSLAKAREQATLWSMQYESVQIRVAGEVVDV